MLVAGLMLGSAAEVCADVGLIKIDGAIGPATASYIARAVDVSGARNDACLIIQLDTPGGLLDSTKQIVQKLYASTVPTVVYVAPSGANAGSAGCFITLAADVAAMIVGAGVASRNIAQMAHVSAPVLRELREAGRSRFRVRTLDPRMSAPRGRVRCRVGSHVLPCGFSPGRESGRHAGYHGLVS